MISVIVPVYNVENTLRRCLDSILSQSFSNIEVIVVNDGSTDTSGQICREYAKTDYRVHLIEKENGGLSSARNSALDVAQGDYYAFVDSDDWIDKDFLKVLYNDAVKFDSDITVSYTYNIAEDGRKWRPYIANNRLFVGEEALICNIGVGYPCDDAVWNKLYRAELFTNIRFPVGRIHEDTFVMSRLMAQADRVYFDDSVSYFYLQRENSLVHQKSFGKGDIDKVEAYSEVFAFIANFYPDYAQIIGNKYCNCVITTLGRLDDSELSDKKTIKGRILNEYSRARQVYRESTVQKVLIWLLERNSCIPKYLLSLRRVKRKAI